MRPSWLTRHVGGALVAGRSVREASQSSSAHLVSTANARAPMNWGASRVIAAVGTSRGARAPGQIPQSWSSPDPSGVDSDGHQQGAGDAGVSPLLAGQLPQDSGLSGLHSQGRRMSACAMLKIARTSSRMENARAIPSSILLRGAHARPGLPRTSANRRWTIRRRFRCLLEEGAVEGAQRAVPVSQREYVSSARYALGVSPGPVNTGQVAGCSHLCLRDVLTSRSPEGRLNATAVSCHARPRHGGRAVRAPPRESAVDATTN